MATEAPSPRPSRVRKMRAKPTRLPFSLIAASHLALAALALRLIVAPTEAVADERDAWAALVTGSHVALVRHGSAPPGYGDPPGFKIDDCATQRNMDER